MSAVTHSRWQLIGILLSSEAKRYQAQSRERLGTPSRSGRASVASRMVTVKNDETLRYSCDNLTEEGFG